MKNSLIALALVGAAAAHPTAFMSKREVPQEHAHENILRAVDTLLQKNNPDNIKGSVFALLGAKAAAEGAGNIKDTDCLQQAVADQAFTNAKADNDVEGMTNALIFRALERNTGSVGLASAACTSIKAVNPEIAALQQHQDPASDGAAALNKGIAQELTRQIAAIGGDTSLGNEASTFAPGQIGDPTGAGNTCDDANDAKGCINTQGLRVDDLSAAEITAAASGAAGNGAAANSNAAATNDNAASNGNASNQNASNQNQKASNQKASAAENNAASGAADNAATGNAAGNAATAATGAATGAGAFGNCDPTIKFGTPSDGRKEDAFEPADLATFNHGSALNIAVISNFICSQVGNKCKVDAAAVSTCNDAATAANGLKGQAAADAFNSALGL